MVHTATVPLKRWDSNLLYSTPLKFHDFISAVSFPEEQEPILLSLSPDEYQEGTMAETNLVVEQLFPDALLQQMVRASLVQTLGTGNSLVAGADLQTLFATPCWF